MRWSGPLPKTHPTITAVNLVLHQTVSIASRSTLTEGKKQNPKLLSEPGVHQLWQCPTLAQPIDALPSGLQRFTSVFGMGTGGATALGSPEGWRSRS
jgi:hypothetical protein